LMMAKICEARVTVNPEDLTRAFQAFYGEKVECQLIMWPKAEKTRVLTEIYAKIRSSADEFDRVARLQASSQLAATAGRVPAFGRYTTGDDLLEETAFRLHPGELSEVLDTSAGLVVVKCLRHIPANTAVTLDQVRDKLTAEIRDKKIQLEIPKLFA